MHSLFLFYFAFVFILFIQHQSLANLSETSTQLPSIINEEALQWLNLPSRWRSQHFSELSSNNINHLLKQLEQLNENGILQTDIQSMEGISMEVFYEVTRLTRRTKYIV